MLPCILDCFQTLLPLTGQRISLILGLRFFGGAPEAFCLVIIESMVFEYLKINPLTHSVRSMAEEMYQ